MENENNNQQGERPEWLQSKFTDVESQAKSYTDLEKKFGGFTGAPETYNITVDGVTAEDNKSLIEFARNSNMNNDTLNSFLQMQQNGSKASEESYRAEQLKALGEDADTRIQAINDWSKNNVGEELKDAFNSLATSADGVGVLEHLIGLTKEQSPAGSEFQSHDVKSKDEVQAMFLETNENGDRKMSVDPKFRAKVNELWAKANG